MTRCLLVTSHHSDNDAYSYYQDWENGFLHHPDLTIDIFDIQNTRSTIADGLRIVGRYDLVVYMHSVYRSLRASPRLGIVKALLTKVTGPRAFFLSNEFRSIHDKAQMATFLDSGTLITQLNLDDANLVYGDVWSKDLISLPYGFTTKIFKPEKEAQDRDIHIGFRGDYYPAYVGHDDRDLLLDAFNEKVTTYDHIKTDIHVGERLDTNGWAAYLNNCRSIIGHEAGASRVDTNENIRHFLNSQEQNLTPENFRKLVLTMRETGVFNPPPSGRIAAPRNFEAMGTKTLQILLPGRYNDVLDAGVHYVELQRDFSNLDQVITTLMDDTAYTAIVEKAYQDAIEHHTYQKRVDTLLTHILG